MTLQILDDQGLKVRKNYMEVTVYAKNVLHPDEREALRSATDTYLFCKNLFGMDIETREKFFAVYLNAKGEVISVFEVSSGTMTACTVDIKMICLAGINTLAQRVILCHNHPSGNTRPSEADKKITSRLKEALSLCDIELLDHLIVTEYGYTSLSNEGLI